jgi:predicted PurR-regulated permease PerM
VGVVVVVVTIMLVTSVLLVVLLVGLFQQLRVLARSLQELNAAVAPGLEAIQRGSDEAQRRLEALAEQQARIQGARPNQGAGARLRR